MGKKISQSTSQLAHYRSIVLEELNRNTFPQYGPIERYQFTSLHAFSTAGEEGNHLWKAVQTRVQHILSGWWESHGDAKGCKSTVLPTKPAFCLKYYMRYCTEDLHVGVKLWSYVCQCVSVQLYPNLSESHSSNCNNHPASPRFIFDSITSVRCFR